MTESSTNHPTACVPREPIDLSKVSVKEARVLIAKDVLALLDTDFFNIGGSYLAFWEMHKITNPEIQNTTQLDVLLRKADSCSVCALGALLVAVVLRNDALTVKEVLNGYSFVSAPIIVEYLKPYFPEKQLLLVEDAFEGWARTEGFSGRDYMAKHDFSLRRTLQAIMTNIVENNGTFSP